MQANLPDNSIDDMVISNNGDIVKVLATVIQITREMMAEMPSFTIVFKGSTTGRMTLYKRILQKNYIELEREFVISGFVLQKGNYSEVIFDPSSDIE